MNGCCLFILLVTFSVRNAANGQASNATTKTTRKIASKPLGRLQLMECAVLETAEYDRRAAAGLCPPQPTKIAKTFQNKLKALFHGKLDWHARKKKNERKEWILKKKNVLRAVFLGKQSIYQLELRAVNYDFELIEGLFLIMECPTQKRKRKVKDVPNIKWYLDGLPIIADSKLSWRVKITPLKYLQIWPLIVNRDDGRYECFIDGKSHGSITLHVITVGEGLHRGLTNYVITMMLSLPFVVFAIFYRSLHPQREAITLDDPVADFYEKILNLTTKKMKKNITRTVHKGKAGMKRKETEASYSSERSPEGKRMRSNRDTVMTIVYVAEINHLKNINNSLRKRKFGPLNLLKLR